MLVKNRYEVHNIHNPKKNSVLRILFYYYAFRLFGLIYKINKKIIKMSENFFKKIQKKLFEEFITKKGIIEFTTGDHEVFVRTKCESHEKVWIHIVESSDPTCSYLDNDMFSVKDEDVEHGFIILAHIESNSRKVYWFIK